MKNMIKRIGIPLLLLSAFHASFLHAPPPPLPTGASQEATSSSLSKKRDEEQKGSALRTTLKIAGVTGALVMAYFISKDPKKALQIVQSGPAAITTFLSTVSTQHPSLLIYLEKTVYAINKLVTYSTFYNIAAGITNSVSTAAGFTKALPLLPERAQTILNTASLVAQVPGAAAIIKTSGVSGFISSNPLGALNFGSLLVGSLMTIGQWAGILPTPKKAEEGAQLSEEELQQVIEYFKNSHDLYLEKVAYFISLAPYKDIDYGLMMNETEFNAYKSAESALTEASNEILFTLNGASSKESATTENAEDPEIEKLMAEFLKPAKA